MRVTLLGGGGFRVPLLHDALLAAGLPVDELWLHDIDATRLDVVGAVLAGGLPVRTTTDLDAALDGSDLVLSAIRAGGVDGRVRDERAALDLGVLGQETVGAGGLASTMRAVRAVDRIAHVVAERAPRAWTVSMTNPAGAVTEAMAQRLGERVIGVCDSPVGLVHRVAVALGVDPGASLATVTGAADVDYVGINHLGWLRSFVVDGTDLLPGLLADDERLQTFEEGRMFGPDLLRALGAVPNEYLYWYYAGREALDGVRSAGRTRGEHVRDRQREFYAAAAAQPGRARALWQAANDERNRSYLAEVRDGERDEADVAAGGYESVAVALVAALTGRAPARLVLNVRNGTTLSQLPPDVVIETVCDVDAAGARPRPLPELTGHQLGLLATVKAAERAATEAARTGSVAAALRAFAGHPLVGSLEAARQLAAESLLRAEGQSVPSPQD